MSNRPSPDPKSSMWNLIAWYLRVLRRQHRLHGSQFGESIGCSASTLSRLETGELRLDKSRASLIDGRHNTGGLFSLLVWYAELTHTADWKRQHFDLEAKAEVMRIFESTVIPGVFQTPEYAYRLFTEAGAANPEQEVEKRMARQAVLLRDPPPEFMVLLSQNVVDWPIGGPGVIRPQLTHLLQLSDQPNIGLRIIPRSKGSSVGTGGSFKILSGDFGDVVYTEALGGGRLVPAPAEVRWFGVRYDRIGQQALPEDESREFIKQVMEAL